MARHLVVFRRRFRFFVLFFRSPNVIGQETGTCTFKKISRAPRSASNTDIKGVLFSVFQPRNEFFGRSDEAESTREIIGGAKRKNGQWNARINQTAGDLCDRAIASGNQYEIARFFECFFVTAL